MTTVVPTPPVLYKSAEDTQQNGVNPTLITVLMASYIDSDARIKRLSHCLESAFGQLEVLCMIVGMCARTAKLAKRAKRLFAGAPSWVRLEFMGVKQIPQFVIYKALAGMVESGWILFSDDDDIWHPLRVSVYQHMVETAASKESNAMACNLPLIVRNREGRDVDVASVTQVCRLVLERRARLDAESTEYVSTCVRADVFRAFFEMDKVESLLSNQFCDRYFSYFVRTYKCDDKTDNRNYTISAQELGKKGIWVYFHRNVPDGKAKSLYGPRDETLVRRNMDVMMSTPAPEVQNIREFLVGTFMHYIKDIHCNTDLVEILQIAWDYAGKRSKELPAPFAEYALRLCRACVEISIAL